MSYRPLFFAIIFGLINIEVNAEVNARPNAVENAAPSSVIVSNETCIGCHQKLDGKLVYSWRTSAHATTHVATNVTEEPIASCISCHGGLHKEAGSKARRDRSCVSCHGGEKAPVVHSYASSKHGTLMRLEEKQEDWSQSLELANYRVPGCAYCHMHAGNHDVSEVARSNLMDNAETEKLQDRILAVCQDCHSSRYISRLFSNGEAMLEIARKKVREASEIIRHAEKEFTDTDLLQIRQMMKNMEHHLKNVYLGVAHQSPDYQWWHGQPALDGDLLRIKGGVGELRRGKMITPSFE